MPHYTSHKISLHFVSNLDVYACTTSSSCVHIHTVYMLASERFVVTHPWFYRWLKAQNRTTLSYTSYPLLLPSVLTETSKQDNIVIYFVPLASAPTAATKQNTSGFYFITPASTSVLFWLKPQSMSTASCTSSPNFTSVLLVPLLTDNKQHINIVRCFAP